MSSKDLPREGNGADQPGQEAGIRSEDPWEEGNSEGLSPRKPETMPRAEDDAATFERSPEYNDRPTPRPDQGKRA